MELTENDLYLNDFTAHVGGVETRRHVDFWQPDENDNDQPVLTVSLYDAPTLIKWLTNMCEANGVDISV
jgi:hypothetical protein